MSPRPHGKGNVVSDDSEGLVNAGHAERKCESSESKCNGEKHVHLTNSIHIRRHLHLQRRGIGGLMLDARRTTPQLPLLREVTALQKIRTLQDPGTSSGSVSSAASSAGRTHHSKHGKTFIGDPHRDAQALAVELSGKLAKVSYSSDGASSRVSRRHRSRGEKKSKNPSSKRGNGGGFVEVPTRVDVRDRIKRIEQAFRDGSTTNTLSGELRHEGLIKELKERGRIQRDREVAEKRKVGTEIPPADERWEGGPARREEIARRVIEEHGSSVSSLSQLLGTHYGSGRSAQLNLLGMVDDEADQQPHSSHHGESLFETDQDELSPMEREMTRPRPATLNPASPLHLASLSRGKVELKRPRNPRSRKAKPGSKGTTRERNPNSGARPRSKNSVGVTPGVAIPPHPGSSADVVDDELDVSELPPQNGCGVPWDWSRVTHKHGGKAFLDLTGLAPESTRRGGGLEAEPSLPVQSISSLDSDANALPLIIGEDAHDSDFAGYSIETGRSREVPQKLASKRKASLQNAVKDVQLPVKGEAATPEGPRTLTQKYRPKNFREIVGQVVVVKSLSTAIVKGKVAPVYLFMGPRGTGKTSAARVFAAGLNCESLDYARRPCGICRECGTNALNRSADVREIDAASNADLASLRATMGSLTPVGRYKVFIVEGCDSLGTDVWNAFLKVLEEPPTNVVFILIATDHADRIPATATSRCQKFHFSKVKEADIVTRLESLARKEGLDVEEGALALIASRSDGSLRDAEIVLDQVCLLDENVSVDLVRELVGLLPDSQILDLLDYALSADTMNTVRTLREVLASGVEPLSLVSQLGALIADILAGSYDVRRETRGEAGFFNRNFSMKEEQHRLRQALKILSESEKQLRVTSDRATWLTAALLQFAPDRSFLPSEANNSVAQSPLGTQSAHGPAPRHSLPRSDLPSMDEPEYQTQLGSSMEIERETLQAYVAGSQRHEAVENAASLSEQKLEEAWGRVPVQQQVAAENVGETSETLKPESILLESQVYSDEALAELWNQVLWEITSRSLKHLLQTHGRLVGAGVAVDGSYAVVELEFDHPRDKHKAERSWRSICIAFQAVLSTAVELRIALSDMPPEDARIGETMTDIQAGPSTSLKNTEIVTEDSNGDYSIRPGNSNREQKQIADEIHTASRGHRRPRGTKSRKHRESDLQSPGGITPRRLPPSRRRRTKRNPKPAKPVIPVQEMRLSSLESSSFGGGEVWDSGPQLIVLERPSREKKLLSTMMEEPQSEIEDIRSARKKIWEQRSARINVSQPPALDRRTSTVDGQRGLPRERLRCWKMASPRPEFLMRRSRVKGLQRARGKALFLRMVPCSHSRNTTSNAPPASIP